jgi:uncharacterized protein (TIGR01244 family)
MENARWVSAKVAVGGQPTAEDLRSLRNRGVATVVNLRLPAEADGSLAPDAEGGAARAAGLDYQHIPVAIESLGPAPVERLRAAIEASDGPVYVHCGAGQRACSLALLATAEDAPAPYRDLPARAAELGFPIVDERLAAFVREHSEQESWTLLQAV